MKLRMSKEIAELLMIISLVGTIPAAFFMPEVPTILVFIYGASTALLIYTLYFIGAVRAGEKPEFAVVPQRDVATNAATLAEPKTLEQRSAQEIINEKLQGGVIEAAIDKKFDDMIAHVVDDLFGKYGDVSKEIKTQLMNQMNPYVKEYDFSQHNVKLEMLMNEMVKGMVKDQDRLIKNTRTLMGLDPINEIKTTEIFEKFSKHCGENIDNDKLTLDTDDTPSYRNLTVTMTVEDKDTYSTDTERKTLQFRCQDDESLDIDVEIMRWVNFRDNNFHISSVTRVNQKDDTFAAYRSKDLSITSIENPVSALKQMNDLDVFLVKLHQDHATIIIDEDDIYDEDVEVEAEPEYSIS